MGALSWYKHDPEAFLEGVAGMHVDEIGTYIVIIDMLYARSGDLDDNDETIAYRLRLNPRSYRAIKQRLIAAGKVWIEGGKLHAKKVERVLKGSRNESEQQSKRARKGWEKRKKTSKNSAPVMPPGNALESESDTDSELEERDSSSSPTESLFDKSSLGFVPREKFSRGSPTRKARGSRTTKILFPSDWKPDETDIAFAMSKGYARAWIDEQVELCRDHHVTNGNRFIDFHGVWRTWVRRAPDFAKRHSNGHANGHDAGSSNEFSEPRKPSTPAPRYEGGKRIA